MTPAGNEAMNDYRLAPMIGFEMELCLATVRIVMGGILKDCPNLKFIIGHMGGAIPYLVERIENCFRAYPECKVNIQGSPKNYLKKIYLDAVSFHLPALMCAYAFCGADHMLFASDMPYDSEFGERYTRQTIHSIEQMNISDSEKKKIFEDNARELLRLPI